MTITIVTAGITVIEDNGRTEYTHLGVPISGAFDKLSYQLACQLINEPDAAVFEILRGPFQLTTDQAILLTVVGDARVSITGATSSVNSVFVLEADKTLSVIPNTSAPVYLAIKGLLAPAVLGSASYDTLSNLGCGSAAVAGSERYLAISFCKFSCTSAIFSHAFCLSGKFWTLYTFPSRLLRTSFKLATPRVEA